MQSILHKFGKFPENLVGVYVAQILSGLSFLHSNAILHRDIKPGNILLLKEGVIKLADFGVSRIQNGLNTFVGSPYWIAPEILQLKGATSASDIWSLGCTIIQLVDGKAPYQDLQPMAAMFRIGQDEHPPFPVNISTQLRNFLSKCLVHVPSARATADELRQHEWIRACLREQQRDGVPHDNYERDIRVVKQWNQVLQNSSPRDVKRFSVHNAPVYTHQNSNSTSSYSYSNGENPNSSSNNLNNSYSLSRTRDDLTGIAIASGISSMGLATSAESTRRTVSSIAGYEEDSGDDWDNAFENLDALQLRAPRPRPALLYPQSIGATSASPSGPNEAHSNHSLGVPQDISGATGIGSYMPMPVERAVSDPANGANNANSHNANANNGNRGVGHVSMSAVPYRPHTSPPSPRMQQLMAENAISPPEYVQFEEPATAAGYEHVHDQNGDMFSNDMEYFGNADVRLEPMTSDQVPVGMIGSNKRQNLGFKQDQQQQKKPHRQQTSNGSASQLVPASQYNHERGLSSQMSVDNTPNASTEQLPIVSYQQQCRVQQGQATRQKQLTNSSSNSSRTQQEHLQNVIPPGFPTRASEEMLRRETEIKWVHDIGTSLSSLEEIQQEDALIYRCQQIVALLREGRGVFSTSREWRVHPLVNAIRDHQANANVLKHLLLLVNRLCHMNPRFSRTFCLHGLLPLVLPTLEYSNGSADELRSETIRFVYRLCISEDPAAVQMLLSCDGLTALCTAIDRLGEMDMTQAVTGHLSRVMTSLVSLVITKAIPSELTPTDVGDLLFNSQIAVFLSKVFDKYGQACRLSQLPSASSQSSANDSDSGQQQQHVQTDNVYHRACDILQVASRLFNEIVRRIDTLQDHVCESGVLGTIFTHLHRYPRKAVIIVIHGVRFLSKNPMSLEALDKAGIFAVSAGLLNSSSAHAYREYVMTTLLRLCSSSQERQNKMATTYPALVTAAMEYAQMKEAPMLSKCGRLIILGLASGGAQCCRVLKEVRAFELIVKLTTRERWCGMAIRALLEWTKTVPGDIVPSLTGENATQGWDELARPLLNLSTSSTTLDMYAATFYSLLRLYVPLFPRACMGNGEVISACIWVQLMDRYIKCSGLSALDGNHHYYNGQMQKASDMMVSGDDGAPRPEVVSANRMNATTRLTFLNLLLLLQPHLQVTKPAMSRRVDQYYNAMVISSKLDGALPVRKASLELSLALEQRM